MNTTDLLAEGLAWTSARVAAVPASGLDSPTPCSQWDLRQLLDHTIGSLTLLTDAVDDTPAGAPAGASDVRPLGPTSWDRAIAELSARSAHAWKARGVMDRNVELPIGTQPAPAVVMVTLLETVVHGWDISQASGEAAQIPDALALPVLEFARAAVGGANRGNNFAADLGTGDTPSDQLVAYLGRKPR
jgi:uncharacterized protein (TIGR03086 family)